MNVCVDIFVLSVFNFVGTKTHSNEIGPTYLCIVMKNGCAFNVLQGTAIQKHPFLPLMLETFSCIYPSILSLLRGDLPFA